MLYAWIFDGFWSVGRTDQEAVVRAYENIRGYLESTFAALPHLVADQDPATRANTIEKMTRETMEKGVLCQLQCLPPRQLPQFPAEEVIYNLFTGATTQPMFLTPQQPQAAPNGAPAQGVPLAQIQPAYVPAPANGSTQPYAPPPLAAPAQPIPAPQAAYPQGAPVAATTEGVPAPGPAVAPAAPQPIGGPEVIPAASQPPAPAGPPPVGVQSGPPGTRPRVPEEPVTEPPAAAAEHVGVSQDPGAAAAYAVDAAPPPPAEAPAPEAAATTPPAPDAPTNASAPTPPSGA